MKLIIAHLPTEAFEQARTELFDVGVTRTTISEVRSSGPWSATALSYRGAPLDIHLRTELRLECLASPEQAPAVVDVLCGHASSAGLAGRVVVLDLEELHVGWTEDAITPGDPRFDELLARCHFDEQGPPEARRAVIVVHVARIADSCGYGVPLMSYEGERPHHNTPAYPLDHPATGSVVLEIAVGEIGGNIGQGFAAIAAGLGSLETLPVDVGCVDRRRVETVRTALAIEVIGHENGQGIRLLSG